MREKILRFEYQKQVFVTSKSNKLKNFEDFSSRNTWNAPRSLRAKKKIHRGGGAAINITLIENRTEAYLQCAAVLEQYWCAVDKTIRFSTVCNVIFSEIFFCFCQYV